MKGQKKDSPALELAMSILKTNYKFSRTNLNSEAKHPLSIDRRNGAGNR